MPNLEIKRALISTFDKTGVVEFAGLLVSRFGIEIISTGGTAKLLQEKGIQVTLVEAITGVAEMLGGRVKTLHPRIHAAILADRDNPDHMRQLTAAGIDPIDMVVVNLYPFEKTITKPGCSFAEAIEMIDIGGPCMLRAAAKNHQHVLPVCDPRCYEEVLEHLRGTGSKDEATFRRTLAGGAFAEVSRYDAVVSEYLNRSAHGDEPQEVAGRLPARVTLSLDMCGQTKYGENPHQQAAHYRAAHTRGTHFGCHMAEVKPSYNNYVDADAAIRLCGELSRERLAGAEPTSVCVFIKHTNACGVGVASDPIEAYRRAYLGDPAAAMGGILACDFNITSDLADAVMHSLARWKSTAGADVVGSVQVAGSPAEVPGATRRTHKTNGVRAFFVELWIARSFADDAVDVIRTSKKWGRRVKLMPVSDMDALPDREHPEMRTLTDGVLLQTLDTLTLNEDQWRVVTKRAPDDRQMADLRLAWLIAKHTKSNAVSICKDGMLLGNGAGQMSRVMSCRIAVWLAKENGHTDALCGASAASDAFFPFRDALDILADAGVTAIIQPGGSKRDSETIAACDERGAAMIFTGTRHFKH